MSDGQAGPVRTCVVCRRRRGKKELLRFVWRNNTALLDLTQIEGGRGVYCCPGRCQQLFVMKKKKWKGLFRQNRS